MINFTQYSQMVKLVVDSLQFITCIWVVKGGTRYLITTLFWTLYNGSWLQFLIMNHEQHFDLITNHGLKFEAITCHDSRVLSPITDHDKTPLPPCHIGCESLNSHLYWVCTVVPSWL